MGLTGAAFTGEVVSWQVTDTVAAQNDLERVAAMALHIGADYNTKWCPPFLALLTLELFPFSCTLSLPDGVPHLTLSTHKTHAKPGGTLLFISTALTQDVHRRSLKVQCSFEQQPLL